ncbi:MAG: hypothetical protein CSA18_01700 [Deltaproteobacteria bacterium]|nr:MAG: hypothetical protein CSA18_01700 [Deltaproteobacteria bacterium]
MESSNILEFAVLGHPNEGKSSVVSTLTENDRIEVSRFPGETIVSKTYTVSIDNEPVIRFIDTPGFQVPIQTLKWFKAYDRNPLKIVEEFISEFQNHPFFADECQLLAPVAKGAGIIYVVNGSRPVRSEDLAEMEILRLTGCPRMAVINSKTDSMDHIENWQAEFRKHFNSIRIFNSNTADFNERIRMLESLRAIDQSWESELDRVVRIFNSEMSRRRNLVCAYIVQAIEKSIGLVVSASVDSGSDLELMKEKLLRQYERKIRDIEAKLFSDIRSLFKHTLYDVSIVGNNILNHDLFSGKTWEVLGLTKLQLAGAGAFVGGSMGIMADLASHGISLGAFTLAGGLMGAGSAVWGGKKLAASLKHIKIGGDQLKLGPNKNLQFIYVLLDRALIYYSHIINRPHGKRDSLKEEDNPEKKGISSKLTSSQRSVCAEFFNSISRGHKKDKNRRLFTSLVKELVDFLSDSKDFS